jgi:ribonuclease P protein component
LIWRIRERDAFIRLQRDGTRIRTESLWCTFLLDPDATPPRVAFAIGRAAGHATTRNRLRRRLRALLHERTSGMSTAMGADTPTPSVPVPAGWYLIGVRPSATELTFDDLRTELASLLIKVTARR